MNRENNISADELKKIILEGNNQELLESIIESSQGQRELYRLACQLWKEIPLDTENTDFDRVRVLDRIHHQIKLEEEIFIKKLKDTDKLFKIFSRIAAVLFIPLLLAVGFLYASISGNEASVSYSEIYVPAGTRTSFILPDGTKGWLNSGSTLRYPNRFTNKARVVELAGEGYFKAEKKVHQPFIVKTKTISIKVYGTAFNVYAYPDESSTEVVLEEGKVEIIKETGDKFESICYLKPDQAFILDQKTGSKRIVQVDATGYTSWKDGKMVFRYDTFKNVVEKLNRWYNVDIQIKDKFLETYIYYGTFQDETLDEVLRLIKMTAPIQYRDFGRIQNADGTFGKRKIELYYRKP